jgi:hypothetical protein
VVRIGAGLRRLCANQLPAHSGGWQLYKSQVGPRRVMHVMCHDAVHCLAPNRCGPINSRHIPVAGNYTSHPPKLVLDVERRNWSPQIWIEILSNKRQCFISNTASTSDLVTPNRTACVSLARHAYLSPFSKGTKQNPYLIVTSRRPAIVQWGLSQSSLADVHLNSYLRDSESNKPQLTHPHNRVKLSSNIGINTSTLTTPSFNPSTFQP